MAKFLQQLVSVSCVYFTMLPLTAVFAISGYVGEGIMPYSGYSADAGHNSYLNPTPAASYGKSYEEHYPPQPYKFGYDIKDGYGGSLNQKEEGDEYGNKRGSYGFMDSYGIYRQVDYVADKQGFRATIKTNEPGTANQNPAAVYIHSEAAPVQYESVGYGSSHGGHSAPKTTYKSPPLYSSPNNFINTDAPIYKSATHSIPSMLSINKLPVYQMPAMYLSPKTVFKSIPY